MSFRLFIYYCAVCGGWAAFLAWVLGRLLAPSGTDEIVRTVARGLILGILATLSVGLVDAVWNVPRLQTQQAARRILPPLAVGCVGGILGALVASLLVKVFPRLDMILRILGWTLTGSLIGAAVGAHDLYTTLAKKQDMRGALRKCRNGMMGGALGGLVGSFVLLGLELVFERERNLLSPSAVGYVILGVAIGWLTGLLQVVLKEAWLRVEHGFRAGRELMLTKQETVLGRAESCDVGLFGDNSVDRTHARIVLEGHDYVLSDAGSSSGTFVNDERIVAPRVLRSGDLIGLGKSLLRFGERAKKVVSS